MSAGVVKAESVKPDTFGVLTVTRLLTNQIPFSVAQIELDGENRLVRNRDCNAAYYVLQGNGRFTIEGIETEVGQ